MRPLPIIAYATIMAGCVTQSTYDRLKGERDGLETTLEEKNKALAEGEKRERALEDRIKAAQEELEAEKGKAKDLTERIDRLAADIAAATKDKSRLQASIEEMTAALADLEKRRAEAEARVKEFKSLLQRFKSLIDAGKLTVRIVDGRMVVVLATDVLFPSGSASLSKDGKQAIAEVARVLASIPQRSFQVEGHTDNVPIATSQYPSNWELAAARAITVLNTMVDAGLPARRVSAASFADTRPVAPNDTADGRTANRRIAIIIVPDLSSLPGFEELQRAEKGG